MAKCIICGLSTAAKGHIEIENGDICLPCFTHLGFRPTEGFRVKGYKYDDIKDGPEKFDLIAASREK
jgi:hypothetical protein